MDIAILKAKLINKAVRRREGDPLDLFWQAQREWKPTFTGFWRILIRILSKLLVKVYSVSLAASENLALAIACGLSEILDIFWLTPVETPSKIKLPRYECDRGPHESFLPLPDAEIGGCARNDSLTAPLVN